MDGIVSQVVQAVVSQPVFVVPAAPEAAPMISSRMRGDEIERVVRREVPVGSTLVEAQEFLESAGLECKMLRGETSFYGSIRELSPPGDGILRATMTNRESHWPAKWNCVVDIHIVRGLAADCRVVAFESR